MSNPAGPRLIFDAESNGLLYAEGEKPAATKVHCICTKDIDTGEKRRFRGDQIIEGIRYLQSASLLINHNLLAFDIPLLERLYPGTVFTAKRRDTLVLSLLIWTNLWELDSVQKRLPKPLWGLHKLEAWGQRLRVLKGEYGKTTDWQRWSPEMEDYCAQDIEVTHALWQLIERKEYSETAVELEHTFKSIILLQEWHGFRFDEEAGNRLTAQLQGERAELTQKLQTIFPPTVVKMKTPQYWSEDPSDIGCPRYPTKGAAVAAGAKARLLQPGPPKEKHELFNPGSRVQIANRLIAKYGWKPTKFTDSGQVQIDESVLSDLDYPEAEPLIDYLIVGKTLGQLAEGDGAVMKLLRKGRVHGGVITNGAVTGRCTHSKPNVAQTPKVMVAKGADGKKAPVLGLEGGYGWEFRACYIADHGQVLCGWDASSLELRCLAHYLYPYDNGAFERLLLEGDVHTSNQQAAGFYLRDSAKTFIYAFLYGAGDEKLGKIARQDCIDAGKPLPKGNLRTLGKKLRARFLKNFPALKRLKDDIEATVKERPYLVGLDGRRLHVRSSHAALNTLLQSAGALLMKKALVFQFQTLLGMGYRFGRDFAFVANIHDEVQTTCRPEIAETVGKSGPAALKQSGEFFKFRCRLDGEFKIGPTWAHTH